MEVSTNVFRFDTGPFNWYIVRDGRELTLVDAGFSGHYGVLVTGLSSLGHTVADIKCVLLTHAHADHMGFAERVRQEANCPVFIHSKDKIAAGRILQLPWFGLLSNAWRPFVASILTHATFNSVFINAGSPSGRGDVGAVPMASGKPMSNSSGVAGGYFLKSIH